MLNGMRSKFTNYFNRM